MAENDNNRRRDVRTELLLKVEYSNPDNLLSDYLTDVSNGRFMGKQDLGDGFTRWDWRVNYPINSYNVSLNIGAYVQFSDRLGDLTLDFYVLPESVEKAKVQFAQAKPMIEGYQKYFGEYPFKKDGYKLIEVPYSGMEHQSAVAYGNRYANGYRGRDASGTGYGMNWDFIIMHESAHEWFGNNISTKDLADMWVHESFANYAEGIYTECRMGKSAGAAYVIGVRNGIRNDRPIIPAFGVNAQGSGDMYPKGGNMLHTIRTIIDDDARWRGILRGLNQTFRHQTVSGRQVEDYISRQAGVDLSRIFAQYLTTTWVPVLEYKIAGKTLTYRWSNVVPEFDMPVRVTLTDKQPYTRIRPTVAWQTAKLHLKHPEGFRVDERFYVTAKNVGDAASR